MVVGVVRQQEIQVRILGTCGSVRVQHRLGAGSCVRYKPTEALARITGQGLHYQLGRRGGTQLRDISTEHTELRALGGYRCGA